ncbi:hypothetical protein HWV62_17862 [Athelia sp. TMB]|nr:hypothetical protein HWV62_17862 [Athelia sp. TMB]
MQYFTSFNVDTIRKQRYQVLLVFDPAGKEYQEEHRASWSFEEIPAAEANIYLDDARYNGWILRTDPERGEETVRTGYVSVQIYEWVWQFILLSRRGRSLLQLLILIKWRRQKNIRMDVTFMSWADFKSIMTKKSTSGLLDLAKKFDCLLGGADLSQEIKTSEHELTNSKHLDIYIRNIQYLSWAIAMWPPAKEAMYSKHKYDLIMDLDSIAKTDTATCRPVTALITRDSPRPLSSENNPKVVKREESNTCKNIHFPEVVHQLNEKEIASMYPRDGQPRWMLQTYVPYVARIGEWRIFMRDGQMMQGIITTPHGGREKNHEADVEWSWTMLAGQYSLQEMREIIENDPNYVSDDVSLREGGREEELLAARLELTQFTETTLKALILKEKERSGARFSSLELFCRLDVSVIDNEDGELHYWVNEVERGPYAVLYSNEPPLYQTGRVADELAQDIPNWLDRLRMDECN